MDHRLTKSAFLQFLRCPPEFWLRVNQPLVLPDEVTLEGEHLRQQGYAVQQLAKTLGRFAPAENLVFNFERAFETQELYSRTDIVGFHQDSGEIDLYETKSGASIKDEYLDDLAFQRLVCEESGYTVGGCFLITVNTKYVRKGKIDPEQLLVVTDVSDLVEQRLLSTKEQVRAAFDYLGSKPVPSLLDYCNDKKLDCEFIKLYFPDLPEYSIFDIGSLSRDKQRQLMADGIVSIVDVPDDFPLSDNQRRQVEIAKSGTVSVDRDAISERLKSWKYPLRFLDYETFGYAIPQFEGLRPYQAMCFQYSLHTIDSPGSEPRHSYFLARSETDPARALAEHLRSTMDETIGTVLVWNESFEKCRNSEMAEMFPDLAPFFTELNERTVDLMKIFSDKLYIHPDFRGRSTIKRVLPVLRPELSYKQLRIGDGNTASISWYRAAKWATMSDTERDQVFRSLEEYCELDTYAMVAIFQVLSSLGSSDRPNSADQGEMFLKEIA